MFECSFIHDEIEPAKIELSRMDEVIETVAKP